MSENIDFGPSGQIQFGPRRQKIKAGLGQGGAAFAGQHLVQLVPEGMQMNDVGGGIPQLFLAQFGRSPIRRLLLLLQFDAQQLLAKILEPMPVGERADQA